MTSPTPPGVPHPVVPLPGKTSHEQIGDITGGPISPQDWAAASPGLKKLMIQGWIAKACQEEGVDPSVWGPRLSTLTARESGGYSGGIADPNIVNLYDVNAQAGMPSMGIAQVIQSNAPGQNLLDPVVNLRASIRHIKQTYGDIRNVQQADPSRSAKGYAKGGPVQQGSGYGTRWHVEVDYQGKTYNLPLIKQSGSRNETYWKPACSIPSGANVRVVSHNGTVSRA